MTGRIVSDEEDDVYEREDLDGVEQDAVDEEDGGRDAVEDEDDEEDEEGQNEYEKDGFIVDDDEEEEPDEEGDGRGNSDEEERHKKKKKRRRDSEKIFVLDEDDYELLQDNNITNFHRPKPVSKKFKRLVKAGRDGEGRSAFSDEEEDDMIGHSGRTDEEKIKYSLFGDDESAPLEDIAEEEHQEEEEDIDIGEDDEMADFIVDEEDVDEDGVPVRRNKVKKKKARQAGGVSSSALQEAHDIFGDVDDYLEIRKMGLSTSGGGSEVWGEKRIEDEFEPQIIEKNYMTNKDNIIRDRDEPERIQLFEEITSSPPVDDKSIEDEATWIYDQLISGPFSTIFSKFLENIGKDEQKNLYKEDIGNVLMMLHVQKFDIPFIAMYRKELCLNLLKDPEQDDLNGSSDSERTPNLKWHKVLWAIQSLDMKWLLIQKRKLVLRSHYGKRFQEETMKSYEETRVAHIHRVFKSICDALEDARTEREVDDVDMKFNLHFPPGEVDVVAVEGQHKRPKRKSFYSTCCKAGLWEVSSKIGRTSEQLGLLLALVPDETLEELMDAKETPDEIAANFTCALFEKPADVLKGARYMASVEISCEPNIRKHVRTIFMEKAVVSTSPTPEGNAIIDDFHQLSGVKWLKNKPLSSFVDGQWLLIQKAEEDKLLQVSLSLPEPIQKKLMDDANDYYTSEFVSKPAKLWNMQRNMILNDSFLNFILPSMEKEARLVLTSRAKNWLLMEYGKQLWKKISVGPYPRKDNAAVNEEEFAPRVMSCCWGPGKPATTFVMLDSAGEVLDVLYAGSISLRSHGINEQKKKNDQQQLLRFISDHQPSVICVGAANTSCKPLKDEINEVIFKILEHHPGYVPPDFELVPVFGDESLPRLYENSMISSDQLPGQTGIVKRAVALGRYRQNPLAMVATLCGLEKEILSWKLCPLEHFLTPDEKYGMIEQVMVDATNQIGIDINMACSHEWLFAPLQFISGLGPRKASSLQRALVRAGSIFSRKEITMGVLKKKVFINCAGFLRVRRSGAASTSSQIIDLLDDTRIHPESYDLAKTMAKDVYSHEQGGEPDDMDEDAQEMAIEHVRDNPTTLHTLIIDQYAQSLEDNHGTRKRETVCDIKRELVHGFEDWRSPYTEPNQDEEFEMISGETDETLSEGSIIQVSVRFVQEQRVVCQLDSGLKGFISIQDFADREPSPDELQDMVHEGDILTCKIRSVQKARCLVYLTHKESDLRRKYNSKPRPEYYQENHTFIRGLHDKERKERERAKSRVKSRMIVHPNFLNMSKDEAKKFLSDKEVGEKIIHPSSRGPSYLTLTLKVYDGVYAHKEIIESDKDKSDITSLLRIGKKLSIGDSTYEDLDEVVYRYVDPLVLHLKSMIQYRKFRAGEKTYIDNLLKAEKAENPSRILYCFGIAHEYPGSFILTYIRSSNPHHEYVTLYPNGFKFRKREFSDIDHLVAYFQRHINDSPQPDISSVAAVVPIRSPATGGSSDSRWRGQMDSDGGRSFVPRNGSRFDQRSRDGHPSGAPRPFGRGGGRGRGNNSNSDTGYGSSKWSGVADDGEDGLSSFPGAKIQNSPGREKFPGSWGGGNGSNDGGSSWGGGGNGGGSSRWGGGGSGSGGGSWGGGGSSWGGGGGESKDPAHDGSKGWGDSARLVPPPPAGGSGWSSGRGGGD